MIRLPARKTPALEAFIYRALVRPAFRSTFHRVALLSPESAPPHDLPTVIYSNHPSWWDGYIVFLLSYAHWHRDGYLMMEEAQLARYSFFRYCGVFSVDRDNAREGMRSVAYAASLLNERRDRLVWLFPQGEITPNDRRPLTTYAGAAHIAKRAVPCRCIPMALRFEFSGEQQPEALIRLGPAHIVEGKVDARQLHREMDARLLHEIDALHDDVSSGTTTHYQTILRGRSSVNVVWDRVRHRFRRS